jgi:hypothetical protein
MDKSPSNQQNTSDSAKVEYVMRLPQASLLEPSIFLSYINDIESERKA